jgi:hypothetical protein
LLWQFSMSASQVVPCLVLLGCSVLKPHPPPPSPLVERGSPSAARTGVRLPDGNSLLANTFQGDYLRC